MPAFQGDLSSLQSLKDCAQPHPPEQTITIRTTMQTTTSKSCTRKQGVLWT